MGIKLIAFDLDGVLIDGCGSWREVHNGLGTAEQAEKHANEYREGKINFDEWARKDASLWQGVEIGRIREILYKVELMPGIEKTIPRLKERYKMGIISGGLQIMADRIKDKFKMDYAVGNSLLVKDGRVYGVDQLVDFHGKGKVLEAVARDNGVALDECAVVGDFINDIPMFEIAGFRIAFNPKSDEIVEMADEVIYEKDLTRILPFFEVI
ncbi:MAG: HAD family phosphatase [Candidatus Altiarchaeales archaeon]|nr:HAD family phosphatase [Candidatus Altiarchaeota archaeon]MBU4341342.1 HAD family phosphatase [Candidatus Altiarchaeota archaeon]MBU4437339.1 HAD family phosphatase [Candidatus Altiarchaeota archaeon]MCG2782019.1 HAD family phosphatase [Candidatus Altiarchaeales archaeon]